MKGEALIWKRLSLTSFALGAFDFDSTLSLSLSLYLSLLNCCQFEVFPFTWVSMSHLSSMVVSKNCSLKLSSPFLTSSILAGLQTHEFTEFVRSCRQRNMNSVAEHPVLSWEPDMLNRHQRTLRMENTYGSWQLEVLCCWSLVWRGQPLGRVAGECGFALCTMADYCCCLTRYLFCYSTRQFEVIGQVKCHWLVWLRSTFLKENTFAQPCVLTRTIQSMLCREPQKTQCQMCQKIDVLTVQCNALNFSDVIPGQGARGIQSSW